MPRLEVDGVGGLSFPVPETQVRQLIQEAERRSNPQTLVCTKTRRSYERRCEQYKADIASFAELARILPDTTSTLQRLASTMAEARQRAVGWTPAC
jgi:hypothetical protein